MKVVYQGIPGSYSHQAVHDYFPEHPPLVNVKTFEEVFVAVVEGEADYGVVPIENSSTGGVIDIYDLLSIYDIDICGEIYLKINHCLLALPGTDIEGIQEIYSHAQALSQCRSFFKNYPDWHQIPYYNTAMSARLIVEKNNPGMAAIASEAAAEIYGLNILARDINSQGHNTTRFIIFQKDGRHVGGGNKISSVLKTPHSAGSLYRVLGVFAKHGVNLYKLESRPVMDKPWEYFFFLDFAGDMNDPEMTKALEEVKKECIYFKLLGNYTGKEQS